MFSFAVSLPQKYAQQEGLKQAGCGNRELHSGHSDWCQGPKEMNCGRCVSGSVSRKLESEARPWLKARMQRWQVGIPSSGLAIVPKHSQVVYFLTIQEARNQWVSFLLRPFPQASGCLSCTCFIIEASQYSYLNFKVVLCGHHSRILRIKVFICFNIVACLKTLFSNAIAFWGTEGYFNIILQERGMKTQFSISNQFIHGAFLRDQNIVGTFDININIALNVLKRMKQWETSHIWPTPLKQPLANCTSSKIMQV